MRGSVFYKNLNERLVAEALASSRSFIASNAPSFEHGKGKALKVRADDGDLHKIFIDGPGRGAARCRLRMQSKK